MAYHSKAGNSKPRNLLITGIPRSGTTLTCWLINQLPNSVALAEPMDVSKFTQLPHTDAQLQEIERFIEKVRRLALTGQPLPGKVIKGGGSNLFSPTPGGLRRSMVVPSARVELQKTLQPDFLLAIKHPNVFAALLPVLTEHFECCAVVRNPLSILASWETITAPVHNGHAVYAEAIDSELQATLGSLPSVVDRQLALLDWYFGIITSTLPRSRIIHYEDIISSSGGALFQLIPEAAHLPNILKQPLTNRNQNRIYDNGKNISQCAETLLDQMDHACWKLYSRSKVIEIFEATGSRRR